MKAVELRNPPGRTHWVFDDNQTVCGRFLIDLPVKREFDTRRLTGDACAICLTLADSGGITPAGRITLPASYGRLRKQGPLSHGPRSKWSGQRLRGGDE